MSKTKTDDGRIRIRTPLRAAIFNRCRSDFNAIEFVDIGGGEWSATMPQTTAAKLLKFVQPGARGTGVFALEGASQSCRDALPQFQKAAG